MDLARFGEALRRARESKKLTQEQVVERLGRKDITAISEYENGKRRLAAFELPDYAHALGVPITQFFEEIMPEDELEQAVVAWFRTLPNEKSKRRVFTFMRETAPLILGADTIYQEPQPIEHTLSEERDKYRRKSKRT